MFENQIETSATNAGGSAIHRLVDEALETIRMAADPDRKNRLGSTQIIATLSDEFQVIDSNNDGSITKKELIEYNQRKARSPESKVVTDFVLRNYDEFASLATTKDKNIFDKHDSPGERIYDKYFSDVTNGLTRKDVSVLETLQNNVHFKFSIAQGLAEENKVSVIGMVGSGALGLLLGTAAILSPEPVTKTFAGGAALGCLASAGIYSTIPENREEQILWHQFHQRKRMIDSWK